MKQVVERIIGWGHENIVAKNKSTFEITKDSYLTTKGDCIIAVNASKGAFDLDPSFKKVAAQNKTEISMHIKVDDCEQAVSGRGGSSLTFQHPTDLVVRKSNFQCERTLMIRSNKAAFDFPSDFVAKLQQPENKIFVTIIAEIIE